MTNTTKAIELVAKAMDTFKVHSTEELFSYLDQAVYLLTTEEGPEHNYYASSKEDCPKCLIDDPPVKPADRLEEYRKELMARNSSDIDVTDLLELIDILQEKQHEE